MFFSTKSLSDFCVSMKKFLKRVFWFFAVLFVVANMVVYNHAYHFTHFSDVAFARPKKPEELSLQEKLKALFKGVRVPKPRNHMEPHRPFETVSLQSHERIEAWDIPVENSKGIVILFHGYISCKANTIPYSNEFNKKGYRTLLVDFMGHGGSEGLETTIGYKEGRDVKEAFDFAKKKYPNQKIILFGSSMGAVSIMKSIEQYDIKPDKIILECPFGSLLETAKGRFEVMGLPTSPLAQWLILFGGWQTGFDAFAHNPIEYAKSINIPTALFNGGADTRVSRDEINKIYDNLQGEKQIVIFKNSAHQNYLSHDAEHWNRAVDSFLAED